MDGHTRAKNARDDVSSNRRAASFTSRLGPVGCGRHHETIRRKRRRAAICPHLHDRGSSRSRGSVVKEPSSRQPAAPLGRHAHLCGQWEEPGLRTKSHSGCVETGQKILRNHRRLSCKRQTCVKTKLSLQLSVWNEMEFLFFSSQAERAGV